MDWRNAKGSIRARVFWMRMLLVPMAACGVSYSAAADDQERCACTLEIAKAAFLPGEPINVEISASNRSDRPIGMRRPTILNLVVVAPDGTAVEYTGSKSSRCLSQLFVVEPGKSLSVTKNLLDHYYVSDLGSYKAYAVYRPGGGAKSIRSNQVQFDIVEPDGSFFEEVSVFTSGAARYGDLPLTWQVFTHQGRVYARRIKHEVVRDEFYYGLGPPRRIRLEGQYWSFAELGPHATAYGTSIQFMVDAEGGLHLICREKTDGPWFYYIVPPHGKVQKRGPYRRAGETLPCLSAEVLLKGVEEVQEEPQAPQGKFWGHHTKL